MPRPVTDRPIVLITLLAVSVAVLTPVLAAVGPGDRAQVQRSSTSRPAEAPDARRYGHSRHEALGADVPTVYVVPVKGQMGTDIHPEIYEEVLKDIRAQQPDVIVFILDSSEYPDLLIPEVEDPRESRGVLIIEEYTELVRMLRSDLSDFRQVLWIKDSVGLSSMLALAFDEMYMTPDARFWGLDAVIDRSKAATIGDDDVRAKMSAAWTGFVKSFAEYGDQDMMIADAMLWPEKKLSASFRGREVVWALNDLGEFVIDDDDTQTLALRAKTAEDLLISDGTAESLDDLTFLLGYREYRMTEGGGTDLVDDYVDDWRKAYKRTKQLWDDYNQHMQWASGGETLKWLGRAKRDLVQIIRAMDRYKAVEIRWRTDMGKDKFALEIEVEQMKERIRSLKGRRRGGGGKGGGGGYGGGGG